MKRTGHRPVARGRPLLVRSISMGPAALTRESVAKRETDLWRWRELLPVPDCFEPVSLGEPETPMVSLARNRGGAERAGQGRGRLPTGSFKARGLAMAVTMAKHFGIQRIAMPTAGNAGAALAAYAARAGIETIVFCPTTRPRSTSPRPRHGARVYVPTA